MSFSLFSPLGWQVVGAVCLASVLAAVGFYLKRRLTVEGGRLVGRQRHVPPGLDPYSGRPAWPRPTPTPVSHACGRPLVLRALLVLTLLAGGYYIRWRWTVVDWNWWWLSATLALAETVAYCEIFLVSLSLWRMRPPVEPPPVLENARVDIYITCYNEPVDLVRGTVQAAKAVRHPHRTYVLDDGRNPEMEAMAAEEGVGYIVRSPEWEGRSRHAKAGNISNALAQTQGEFILFQDADQIPYPEILDRTLGYFRDPRVAFVQTPHWFYNAPPDDPLGTQQPIFYGPIMQGKDGFNAAFFCGSNGVIRREALMQAGVQQYSEVLGKRVRNALRAAGPMLERALRQNRQADFPSARLDAALTELVDLTQHTRGQLEEGVPLQDLTWRFQREVERISSILVEHEIRELSRAMEASPDDDTAPLLDFDLAEPDTVRKLVRANLTPLATFAVVTGLIESLDLHRNDEAIPVLPFSTCSVTEDMATAMRIHAMGWKSVYHHEILARGLAPDDLRSAVSQRLRWAQGAFQINLRENPFLFRQMTLIQKLMYLHSAIAYLSGFAIPIFLIAPAAYVLFGIPALRTSGWDLALHVLPYFLLGQLAYRFWTRGLDTWRAEQYAVAFFPLWIESAWTATRDLLGLDRLSFVVTPKTAVKGTFWGEVRWQLVFLALVLTTVFIGLTRIALGWDPNPASTLVNVVWAWIDVILLSVAIDAALYRPYEAEQVRRPVETGPSAPVLKGALATAD